jgi:hemerythrin
MNDDIFCWGDGFAIGLDIVDNQHRKLVSLLSQLAQIHPNKAGDTKVAPRVKTELIRV